MIDEQSINGIKLRFDKKRFIKQTFSITFLLFSLEQKGRYASAALSAFIRHV